METHCGFKLSTKILLVSAVSLFANRSVHRCLDVIRYFFRRPQAGSTSGALNSEWHDVKLIVRVIVVVQGYFVPLPRPNLNFFTVTL